MPTACVHLLSTSTTSMHACMAPRSRQAPPLLLLLVQLSVAAASSLSGRSYYSFPAFDDQATTDGVVVATNSSMLSPATFLFDAQLFREFNQSEGFVLLSRPVALWRAAPDDGAREEASFNTTFMVDVDGGGSADAVSFVVLLDSFPPLNIRNDKHGPRGDTNGSAVPVAAAAVPKATNGIAAVEIGSVSSYGPRPPPGVGLNVTITPNRSSSGADTSQLAVRITYDAAAHRLSVYAHDTDTAAGDPPVNDTAALLLDVPLDLADRLPAQAALVGFYGSTVRDLVVGVHDWELTVDSFADDDVGDGPRREQDGHITSSSSPWLVILLAVLGSAAAVAAVVVSVTVYLVVARRRAVDMEVQQCYKDYFAKMTH